MITIVIIIIIVVNISRKNVCCQPTDLQVALGVFMRRNKTLISELYKYSVCCSYDEVRLFTYSAAVHVAQNYDEAGFGLLGGDTLEHCIVDNFDAEISSPNCKVCVHCLAMIVAEVPLTSNFVPEEVAPKQKILRRETMKDPIKYEVQQEKYTGPKKPSMPLEQAVKQVPRLSFLATQVITAQRALENDFAFFQNIHNESNCPEYNGYNTKLNRQAGMLPQPQTQVAFLPLADRPPAHLDTIKTAIEKGLSLVRAAGRSRCAYLHN